MSAVVPDRVQRDATSNALSDARREAVRVFGKGTTVWIEVSVLRDGFLVRVLDSAQRVRVLTDGATKLHALVAATNALEAMEPQS